MFIRKKPARPHALGEPMFHENHPRPVTRREMLGAGMITAPALVMAPAWLGALLKSGNANALSMDLQLLEAGCGISAGASGIPFIAFDLAGGANLVGSEVLMGVQGGQTNFLSTAGYGKLGLPGNMVPTSSTFISNTLGLLWHSDGAILRGIMSKATTPATAAGTNGAVIAALSQNDTGNNPHNPMYWIAQTVDKNAKTPKGKLLTLIGTNSTVSGGNSAASSPTPMLDPTLQPTKISQPSDATGLVNTGGATADPVAVAALESQSRITYTDPTHGVLTNPSISLFPGSTTSDGTSKSQLQCAYVKTAYTADSFGTPSALDPRQDVNITGGAAPIFTMADFSDGDIAKTATVMKLVLQGYAAAGTIALGGFDYHDNTRATGESRNFKAGQMIGAVLEYAHRMNTPVMIYVFSDGSISATSSIDASSAGRGKLGWQGDNQATASTFFLVYSPNGRPALRNGAASQQIGYFNAGGSVVTTSSPAANSVNQLVQTVVLNYMGLLGTDTQFSTTFPMQGLGSATSQAGLVSFAPIV